jgi:hypothetical protein
MPLVLEHSRSNLPGETKLVVNVGRIMSAELNENKHER